MPIFSLLSCKLFNLFTYKAETNLAQSHIIFLLCLPFANSIKSSNSAEFSFLELHCSTIFSFYYNYQNNIQLSLILLFEFLTVVGFKWQIVVTIMGKRILVLVVKRHHGNHLLLQKCYDEVSKWCLTSFLTQHFHKIMGETMNSTRNHKSIFYLLWESAKQTTISIILRFAAI